MTLVAPPRRGGRVAAWLVIGIVVIGVALIGVALSGVGAWSERDALDPESAGPSGTRALAELLRDQGVEVVVARDRGSATEALTRGTATLALPDPAALSDDAVSRLADAATDVVLLDPRSRTLRLLFAGARVSGAGSPDPVEPACELPEAQRAGAVSPGAVFQPDGDTACYETPDGWGLLVRGDRDGRRAALDARVLFTNDTLAEHGNAALGLNLLGRHARVVWYVPSVADSDLAGADPSLGELTPPWVSPVIVLLLASVVAAGIWRGRRFGPLVAERLPVTVRGSETMEGRARLYARSRDAVHAADQLRIAVLSRSGRLLGLGPGASAMEIADVTAARTGWDRAAVRGILIDELPRTDSQLVALSDRLSALEAAVQAAVRPERNAHD